MPSRRQSVAIVLVALLSTAAVAAGATGAQVPDRSADADALAGSTTVSLTPTEATVESGQNQTFEIVVDQAQNGVGAYRIGVSVADSDVAEVVAIESAVEARSQTTVADDGSSASITAFGMDTEDEGSVTIVTVTVRGKASGTAGLDVTVSELGDEDGQAYTVTGVDDSVENEETTTTTTTSTTTTTTTSTTTATTSTTTTSTTTTTDGGDDETTSTATTDDGGEETTTAGGGDETDGGDGGSGQGMPGFGTGVAVVGIAAGLLLAARRRRD